MSTPVEFAGNATISAISSSTASPPSALERSLIGAFFALSSGASLITYFILLSTLVISKELRSSSFFKAIFSLALNDCVAQFAYFSVAAPSTYYGGAYPFALNVVISSITMEIAWFHSTLLLLFQSFNRLLSICYPSKYDVVFGGAKIWYFIVTAWLVGIAIGSTTFAPCCHMIYFVDEYSFSYDTSQFGATVLSNFDLSYSMTNLCLVQIINVIIFVHIRRRHKSVSFAQESQFQRNRAKRETALFLQLFVTTSATMSAELTFIIIPEVTTSRFGGVFGSVVYIAAMSVNAIVFLFFNGTVNGEAKLLLRQAWKKITCNRFVGKVSKAPHTTQTGLALTRM